MRVYLGSCSRPDLRHARQTAPSHVFGHCWTPQHRGFEHVPYIVDNGVYVAHKNGEEWHADPWLDLLDELGKKTYQPDFIILPDGFNDAEKTIEQHRKYAHEVLDRGLVPAFVLQPGLDTRMQIRLADRLGAKFVFVGGADRFQKAHGPSIVEFAHSIGLKVHFGSGRGEDGLAWAYRVGADSTDTSSVAQNQYWHYLEKLEEATLKGGPVKKPHRQSGVGDFVAATDGGFTNDADKRKGAER